MTDRKRSKWELCLEQEIEVLVEDAPEFARECAEKGLPILLYDQPWNQKMAPHPKITRVFSWKEIVSILSSK